MHRVAYAMLEGSSPQALVTTPLPMQLFLCRNHRFCRPYIPHRRLKSAYSNLQPVCSIEQANVQDELSAIRNWIALEARTILARRLIRRRRRRGGAGLLHGSTSTRLQYLIYSALAPMLILTLARSHDTIPRRTPSLTMGTPSYI
ncbi:hypothetical protein E4U57_004359 [Claviceps arundinis]|uniref:Uncharacterized protein n=1 Tax=Claviceps arundinis TaxID=1623583 RepID=A0ABQ7P761_9HYPO|nr:hypothetical protein E4U57_004359 [Claviceps arundinis]